MRTADREWTARHPDAVWGVARGTRSTCRLAEAAIKLAIVNDYEIVVAGVRAMLDPHSEVTLVQLDARAVETDSVDVVLYDNFGQQLARRPTT